MTVLRFGDNSDYTVQFEQSESNGLWHYVIRNEVGRAKLLPTIGGQDHGFVTEAEARDDFDEVLTGMGANPDDLEEV